MAALKETLKRSRTGAVAGRIAVERARGMRRALGRRDGPMGATHRRFDLEGSVRYIDEVFSDYLTYGGISAGGLRGLSVLELGPGDSFGVALRFLAAGVDNYVATDRFIPFRDEERNDQIYAEIIARLGAEERARLQAALINGKPLLERLPFRALEEVPIEDCPGLLGGQRFDLIVSRAVLEHVHDLDRAFVAMDELLAPGGRMLHKVDLRDHGLFSAGGHNALTFLTVPDRVYRWMGEKTAGLPNRVALGHYRSELASRGYELELLVTHEAGVEEELEPHQPLEDWSAAPTALAEVGAIRPRLLPRYRGLPDEELAISGFFAIVRKPVRADAD